MTESTGNGGDIAARRIPLNISHTVVLSRIHELQVGIKLFVTLLRLILRLLEAKVPEVEFERLLRLESSNNNESTLGRPVNSIAVLLVDSADVTEVTRRTTLELLGSEERDGSLGTNGSVWNDFASGDEHKAVALWFPGKVDDCFFDGINNLDRDALLANTEDLEVGGERLLGLGVAVDLDTNVGSFGLPVQLGIRDVEEISGADNFLCWDRHQTDLGRIAAELRSPVAEKLLICLHAVSFRCSRSPLKIHDTLDLDGGFVEKVHPGQLIDGDGLSLGHTRNKFVVG